MALVQFVYLFSISKINVAAAILLQDLAPCLIALYTFIFTREKLDLQTIAALILATSGCYLVVGAYHMDMLSMNKIGILSGLCSAVAFAWYTIQSEYGMRKYTPWTVIFYALVFAALPWNTFYPPFEAFSKSYSMTEWGWLLYIGILGTALPFGLYLKGVQMIKSTRASITATLEPITAGIISYLFLNEVMEPLQIAGGVLVIFAIIMLQFRRKIVQSRPDIIKNEIKGII